MVVREEDDRVSVVRRLDGVAHLRDVCDEVVDLGQERVPVPEEELRPDLFVQAGDARHVLVASAREAAVA